VSAARIPDASRFAVRDQLGRPLRDLRLSVTDRCNFRCVYCMPKTGGPYRFRAPDEALTFAEMARIVRILAGLGVDTVHITGGEPLLRPRLWELIAQIKAIPGIRDVALTTNGSRFDGKTAEKLRAAGLDRVTISLDALNEKIFRQMNGVGFSARGIVEAIELAARLGFRPVKVNMVVMRGTNDTEVVPMAGYFRGTGHIVRFIEYMDAGSVNRWTMEQVYPADEIVRQVSAVWPVEPVSRERPDETAERYRYVDGAGEFGVIASVTRPFCRHCTRLRLTSDGRLYTCLFAPRGHDLRVLLRSGVDDETLASLVGGIWSARRDRYSEERTHRSSTAVPTGRPQMFEVGG
jgi:cyclic pyranopterin phosphate synthase